MATVALYNMSGEKISDLELNDGIFGIEPNAAVMHAAVINISKSTPGNTIHLTRRSQRRWQKP